MNQKLSALFALPLLFSCSGYHQTLEQNTKTNDVEPVLNSERIQSKYGSYGITVLKSTNKVRVSNLFSTDKKAGQTTRTLAIVFYPSVVDPKFTEEHRLILAGQSIGTTFKAAGWKVDKVSRYLGLTPVSTNAPILRSYMKEFTNPDLATHLYDLFVSKEGSRFHYARITEIHHPDYLGLADLKEHKSKNDKAPAAQAVEPFLKIVDKEIIDLPIRIY